MLFALAALCRFTLAQSLPQDNVSAKYHDRMFSVMRRAVSVSVFSVLSFASVGITERQNRTYRRRPIGATNWSPYVTLRRICFSVTLHDRPTYVRRMVDRFRLSMYSYSVDCPDPRPLSCVTRRSCSASTQRRQYRSLWRVGRIRTALQPFTRNSSCYSPSLPKGLRRRETLYSTPCPFTCTSTVIR